MTYNTKEETSEEMPALGSTKICCKCGSLAPFDWLYNPGNKFVPEHLEVKCTTCSYTWKERCYEADKL